jgi:hypothetical protein
MWPSINCNVDFAIVGFQSVIDGNNRTKLKEDCYENTFNRRRNIACGRGGARFIRSCAATGSGASAHQSGG